MSTGSHHARAGKGELGIILPGEISITVVEVKSTLKNMRHCRSEGLGLRAAGARAVLPSGPLFDHLPEWVGWPPFWLDWFIFWARSGSAPTCSGKSVSLSSRSVC